MNENQFDAPVYSQPPLREYVSPPAWTPPRTAFPPSPLTPPSAYPAAGPYQSFQPAYPGQPTYPGQPAYPGYPGQPTAPTQPYPGYPPYAPYPGYGAPAYSYPGYNGYYPWPPLPPQPRRDRYLLVMAIVAFASSCLTILGGLLCLGIMLLTNVLPRKTMTDSQFFSSEMLFLALACAGLIGGGFCMYHSIRSLFFRKPSKNIWLPGFWTFLLCYLGLLGLGYWQHTQGQDVASPQFTGLLVLLAAILPALAILALGIRRLRFSVVEQWSAFWRFVLRRPKRLAIKASHAGQWPTTWRRLVLALVSGATLSIVLAGILELVLAGSQGNALLQTLNDPNAAAPDPSLYGLLLVLVAVIAPAVEELLKPLAVVVMIGRVRSKAEAFALGLACGIGFNLIETTGYISSGYNDWLHVALLRSGAGLLHGFGAAMMALGWYILTHKSEGRWPRRLLLALGCALYAIFQHAIWNGSWGLTLIPGPIGDFFQTWSWTFGQFTIDGPGLVNIIEMLGMLIFFVFMTGRLRTRPSEQSTSL